MRVLVVIEADGSCRCVEVTEDGQILNVDQIASAGPVWRLYSLVVTPSSAT